MRTSLESRRLAAFSRLVLVRPLPCCWLCDRALVLVLAVEGSTDEATVEGARDDCEAVYWTVVAISHRLRSG